LLQKISRPASPDVCSAALSEQNNEKNFSIKAIPCKILLDYNNGRVTILIFQLMTPECACMDQQCLDQITLMPVLLMYEYSK